MTFTIREFVPADYAAITKIFQLIQPEDGWEESDFREEDDTRPDHCKHQKWVAEVDGTVVGVCLYDQRANTYHPQKFWLDGGVLPEHRKQGVGTALLDRTFKDLEPFEPKEAITASGENTPDVIEFLVKRGFETFNHVWESHLDLDAYNPAPYEGLLEKLNGEGIIFKTYSELVDSENHLEKLYNLWSITKQDEPTVFGVVTKIEFKHFIETRLAGNNFDPDGYFVALDGNDYVAFSNFWGSQPGEYISIGFTGTHPDYRGRGLATALKIIGNEYAISKGFKQVRTSNNSVNAPMLAVNVKMGFDRQPAIVVLKRLF